MTKRQPRPQLSLKEKASLLLRMNKITRFELFVLQYFAMPTSSGPRPNFQQNGNSLRCSHSEVSQRNVHCYKRIVWYAMTLINKLFLIDHQQTTPVKAKHLADVFSSFDFQSHSRTYLINLITTVTRNVDGQQANIKIAKFYLVSSWTAPVCCQTVNVFSWKESLL